VHHGKFETAPYTYMYTFRCYNILANVNKHPFPTKNTTIKQNKKHHKLAYYLKIQSDTVNEKIQLTTLYVHYAVLFKKGKGVF
jgi:hypothetical protein